MKSVILLLSLALGGKAFSQQLSDPNRYTSDNKGKFFVYWGGNRGYYTQSDIRFWGNNYDFTLYDVKAVDRPKGWHIDYINPLRMTIPQTNARVGYFISNHYSISAGVDHMKYVMTQNQSVTTNGYIQTGTIHDATYEHQSKVLTDDFLTFEHTDGLNYVTIEFSRTDDISKWFGIRNTDLLQVNLTEGIGVGLLYPKTNTQLLNNQRYDEFHFSGYGASLKAGLHLTLFKYLLIVSELKGGYIYMDDIRTTQHKADRAKQDFFFFETILGIGAIFRL